MTHQKLSTGVMAGVVVALLSAGCTVKKDEAPPLVGPSELGKSISITITPDVLTRDGASQAVVRVTVRNQHGQPVSGEALRAEIYVGGTATDFGLLSARTIVTGADGTATFTYTAPPAGTSDAGIQVDIAVTPLSSGNFANSQTRTATIQLVPPGVVTPPSGLTPNFTFSPAAPIQEQSITFDACRNAAQPCGSATIPVVSYAWDFGDGRTATGQTVSHSFSSPGNKLVRLTITDAVGRSQSITRTVTVSQSAAPTASFSFLPTPPKANQPIVFNASASGAAQGRHLVNYRWDFGDGTIRNSSDPLMTHAYAQPGTYVVILTVTDDIGRTGVTTAQLTVQSGP